MNLTFEEFIPNNNHKIIISMIISFGITFQSIPIIINVCNLKGLMEKNIKRSSHEFPTPTFGGIAIFASTLIGYFLWNFGDEGIIMHRVVVGFIILFFLGLKDDLFALAPIKKMISQIIAASLLVIGSDLRITDFFGILGIYEIPYVVSVLITIFIFIALINAINLIDGIDGLAAGIGMITTATYGFWFLANGHYSFASISLCLSSTLVGFLYYNFSKENKIFMGDTGSLILGFIITTLTVKFIHFNVSHSFKVDGLVSAPVVSIALLSVPIFDTLRVFSLRIMRKKSPFKADRLHMHHLIVDNGFSHMQTSFLFYGYTIITSSLTYYLRQYLSNTELCVFLIGLFVVYVILGNVLEHRRLEAKIASINKERKANFNSINHTIKIENLSEPNSKIKQN